MDSGLSPASSLASIPALAVDEVADVTITAGTGRKRTVSSDTSSRASPPPKRTAEAQTPPRASTPAVLASKQSEIVGISATVPPSETRVSSSAPACRSGSPAASAAPLPMETDSRPAPGRVGKLATVVFTDLPPELRRASAFAAALKSAYPDHLVTKIRSVSLLRDASGYALRVGGEAVEALLADPRPTAFSSASIRLPRPPKAPQRRFQAVLDGVEQQMSVEDIMSDLRSQLGRTVLTVERLHRRTEEGVDRSRPLTRIRVTVDSESGLKSLTAPSFRLLGLFRLRVSSKTELPSLAQCARCLSWDHRASACRADRRCRRCGKSDHAVSDCPQAREARVCANCGAKHATAFRGCPAHLKAVATALKASSSASSSSAKRKTPSAASVLGPAPITLSGPPLPSVAAQPTNKTLVSYADVAARKPVPQPRRRRKGGRSASDGQTSGVITPPAEPALQPRSPSQLSPQLAALSRPDTQPATRPRLVSTRLDGLASQRTSQAAPRRRVSSRPSGSTSEPTGPEDQRMTPIPSSSVDLQPAHLERFAAATHMASVDPWDLLSTALELLLPTLPSELGSILRLLFGVLQQLKGKSS